MKRSFARCAVSFGASVAFAAPMLFAASCLLTSTPQFTAQQHTAPFLVEAMASPNPAQLVLIDLAANPRPQIFTADVVSQDDPSGDFSVVHSHLFIDLDTGTSGEQPYLQFFSGADLTQPGSLTQATARVVSVSWDVTRNAPPLGCHTATLMAAHNFDDRTLCPCVGDYSQITWQVLICNTSTAPGSCEDIMLDSCSWQETTPQNDCLLFEKAVEDGGTSCPSLDAGTP